MTVYFVIRDLWGPGGTEGFARTLPGRLQSRGVRVEILSFRKLWCLFQVWWRLITGQKEFDLVQSFFLKHTAWIACLRGVVLRRKIICRLAGAGKYGDIASVRNSRFAWLISRWIRKIDLFVVPGEDMVGELAAWGIPAEKIVRIPNGVDVVKFSPRRRNASAGKTVVFNGRLSEEKGLDVLLEAFAKIPAGAAGLLLVGDGPQREELERKAELLNLSGRVIFTGFREEPAEYYQGADMFVLPSFSEGMSNALLEAMACGLPVVATRVSGTVDVVEDGVNGILVDPGDADALAGAIRKILADDALAKRMGEANRKKIVENYSIEKTVDQYLALYRGLAEMDSRLLSAGMTIEND